MDKIGNYKILPDLGLIVEFYSGEIYVDDFILLKRVISREPDYRPDLNSILDVRDAVIRVNEKDMKAYLDFVRGYPAVLGKRNTAYLTNTPDDVVTTIIFSSIVQQSDVPIHTQVFSTTGAILKWLQIVEIDNQKLISILEELKTGDGNIFK